MKRGSTKKQSSGQPNSNSTGDVDPNQKLRRKQVQQSAPRRKKEGNPFLMGCGGFLALVAIIPLFFVYDVHTSWAKQRYSVQVAEKGMLGEKAAQYLVDQSEVAIKKRGRFVVALSGGSMPQVISEGIARAPALKSGTDWGKWHVIWTDERCASSDSDESTSKAWKSFFAEVGVPQEQVYEINSELLGDSQAAAADYQERLAELLLAEPGLKIAKNPLMPEAGTSVPRIDLVMLGMGADGHTASLFPGNSVLTESELDVVGLDNVPVPPSPVQGEGGASTSSRISLTLRAINTQAFAVAFVVAGQDKAETVAGVMDKYEQAWAHLHQLSTRTGRKASGTFLARKVREIFGLDVNYPASLVRPTGSSTLVWFLDTEAAASLP